MCHLINESFQNAGTSNDPAVHFQPQWIPNNFSRWVTTLPNDTTGHISLEHDLFPISATQAPNAIKILLQAGYKIQSPVECNGDMRPYVNQSLIIPHSQVQNDTGVGLAEYLASNSGYVHKRMSEWNFSLLWCFVWWHFSALE